MKNLTRYAGRSGLALVILATLLFGGVTIHTERRLARRYEVPPELATLTFVPTTAGHDDEASSAARGHDLARTAGCAACHGDDLGGKIQVEGVLEGTIAAPNLTSGRRLGPLGLADFVRATRYALKPNGRPLIGMPAAKELSDADLAALFAYISSLPPIDRETPATRLGPLGRVAMTMSTSGTRFALHAETSPLPTVKSPAAAR